MAISMLVIATAVGTKAQPCNEKEERKRAQLRKERGELGVKSLPLTYIGSGDS